MSIPKGGLAALLVVAFALTSCGSDDATVTTTAVVSPSTAARTTTQTTQTTASTPARTATNKAQTTASTPATTTEKKKPQTTASPSTPAATAQEAQSDCPRVDLGVRDGDIDPTFARIQDMRNVDCATVTVVVGQWGGQQIGGDDALLPLGWACRKNTCRRGGSSVSFVVEPPTASASE